MPTAHPHEAQDCEQEQGRTPRFSSLAGHEQAPEKLSPGSGGVSTGGAVLLAFCFLLASGFNFYSVIGLGRPAEPQPKIVLEVFHGSGANGKTPVSLNQSWPAIEDQAVAYWAGRFTRDPDVILPYGIVLRAHVLCEGESPKAYWAEPLPGTVLQRVGLDRFQLEALSDQGDRTPNAVIGSPASLEACLRLYWHEFVRVELRRIKAQYQPPGIKRALSHPLPDRGRMPY